MGALGGFIAGYILGTRAGRKGYEELVESWHTIRTSPEVQVLVANARSLAGGVLRQAARQGGSALADQAREAVRGRLRAV